MNTADLISLFRLHTQDIELPGNGDSSDSLFQTSEILEYINESQQEFARQTNIHFTTRDNFVTTYNVTASNPWVEIDSSITKINRAIVDGKALKILTHRDLDTLGSSFDWESEVGDPVAIVTDLEPDVLRVYPIPTTAVTLQLSATKLPEQLVTTTDELEIPEKYHRKLLHYALFLAYSKHDADSFDPQKADREYTLAEAAYDLARREIGARYKKPRTVRYGGI